MRLLVDLPWKAKCLYTIVLIRIISCYVSKFAILHRTHSSRHLPLEMNPVSTSLEKHGKSCQYWKMKSLIVKHGSINPIPCNDQVDHLFCPGKQSRWKASRTSFGNSGRPKNRVHGSAKPFPLMTSKS